jgi:hypothetical protein
MKHEPFDDEPWCAWVYFSQAEQDELRGNACVSDKKTMTRLFGQLAEKEGCSTIIVEFKNIQGKQRKNEICIKRGLTKQSAVVSANPACLISESSFCKACLLWIGILSGPPCDAHLNLREIAFLFVCCHFFAWLRLCVLFVGKPRLPSVWCAADSMKFSENVLIKGINEENLSDVCGKGVQDGPSYSMKLVFAGCLLCGAPDQFVLGLLCACIAILSVWHVAGASHTEEPARGHQVRPN